MKKDTNISFLKGTIALSLSVIITKILGVAFKVPLSYVLGDEGMGYFNTAYAIYGFFFILCTSGVPKSVMLLISEGRAEKSAPPTDRSVLKCGLKLFFTIGTIVSLFIIIGASFLSRIVGNDRAYLSVIAVAPSVLFVSMNGILRGYLNSNERLAVIAVSQLMEASVKLALGLIFSYVGMKVGANIYVISALAISGISIGSAASFFYMLILSKSINTDNITEQKSNLQFKSVAKKIVGNALPIAISASVLNLSSMLDLAIIIRRLVESGESNEYANSIYGNYTTLAVPMFNLVSAVLAPVATSFVPRLADYNLQRDKRAFTDLVNRLLIITIIIAVPMSLSYYFYSFELLDILFSVQSSAIGTELLVCLSLGLCFMTCLTVVNTALESKGKIVSTVVSLMIGGLVKLIASYLLIGRSNIGIMGAPIGTVLSYAVSLAVSLFVLENSGTHVYAIAKTLLISLVGFFAFYPSYKFLYSTGIIASSFLRAVFALAVSFVTYALMVGLIGILVYKRKVFNMHKKRERHLSD